MNHAYRLVWSAARGAYVIAPETARGRGKSGGTVPAGALVALLGLALHGAAQSQQPPAAPNAVPTSAATQAYVSPNGVTVVNIGAANAAGVSHNKFHRYDVDARGMVLNNNANRNVAAMDSQLAGQIYTNTLLGREAGVILNEVVSPNRSVLAGFTEVLGKKADVIVANPYGITCTGCGFINTDRASLVTGAPVWKADGRVAGFNVAGGDVLINGSGLNAGSQALLDIVTRTLKVDGQVNANDVVLATGANAWNYETREVTGSIAPAGAKNEYAIDTSALGGMYANRIHMIATEAGVGVRMLGEAAARADDFRLDAAGQVVLGGALSAQRDLVVRAARLAASGNADTVRFAGRNIDIHTGGNAEFDGGAWVARGAIDARAGAFTAGGGARFYSGADAGAYVGDRAMRIRADGTIALDGARLASNADMVLAAGSGMTIGSGASAEAGGDITVTARGNLGNDGSLVAARALSVNVSRVPGSQAVPTFVNRGLLQATGASLVIGEAGQPFLLDNSGKLLGSSVDLYAARLFNKGWIQSDTAFSAQAAEIINAREAVMLGKGAGYRFNLSGLVLSNDGLIQSAGAIDVAMDAEQWLATGMFDSAFALNARRIDNRGTIAAAGAARFKSAKAYTNDGRIDGNGIAFVTSALKNQGAIHSGASLVVEPGQGTTVSNEAQGRIVAEEKLVINGTGIVNHGLLQAGDSVEANLSGGLVNGATGTVLANRGDLLLRAYFLDNVGAMQAARSLRATVTDTLDNKGSLQTTGGNGRLELEGASVSNQGIIEAASTALIRSTGIDQHSTISNSGLMQSQGDLVLDSAVAIDNTSANSRILSEKSVLIESRNGSTNVANHGRIQAAEALVIGDSQARAGKVGNHVSGILLGKRFTAMADRLENAGAISFDSAYVSTGSLSNKGQASSIVGGAGGVDFIVASMLENQGALHSNGAMRVRAGGIANRSTGAISALGPLTLIGGGSDISNAGALYSAGLLTLNAIGQTVNNSGSMGAADIAIDAANVTNTNSIVAAHNADIRASREFHNLPAGGMPALVETPSLASEQVEMKQGGSLLDPTIITVNKYTDTITRSLPDGARVVPGQILAGNALRITYGGTAENIASVLSADTLTIVAEKGAQSFVNSGIQGTRTDQVSYVKVVMHGAGINTPPWAEYAYPLTQREALAGPDAYTGLTRSYTIARERAQGLATSVTSPQGPEYRASIQARTIIFDGGKLVSAGDPLAADPGKRSADGAAAENIAWNPNQPGVVLPAVDKALALPFAGLDLRLPGNPNGYFIVARDPAARYLVETNPLFGMAGGIDSRTGHEVNAREGSISGSDYLAMELGFDPERMQKRLGDGGYEQRLIQQQLIAQTGRHLLAGARDEAAQMQGLFKSAAGQAGTLGLRFGVALDAGQINALDRDMVWMVEQEVRGEKVLAPVVYLSRASREGIERGTVIAADDIVMNVAALDNRGGVIAARDSLTVRSKDDIRNTSGVIRGGSVDLQSAKGDIVNATLAETSGDRYRTRTVIGKTATIESSGDMRIEAGRDVVVKGGQVDAGGDATLHAGRTVEVDTVADRRADAASFSAGAIAGLDRQGHSSSTASETHRGSSIRAGGALDASSGGDMRIAGSRVHADGDLLLHSGAGLAVTGRDDTSRNTDSVTSSARGMEGALSSTKTVLVETSRSRNLESAVSSGGKAVVAAQKDVLIKGSSLAAEGKLIVAGDAVTVEAGRDIDRSSTTVTTLSLFKADASGKAAAVAGTEGRARVIDQNQVEALKTVDGELVQDVNGGASRKNDLSVLSKRSSEISVATDEKGKFSGHIASPGWDEKVARNETGSKGGGPVSVKPARGANAGKASGEASSRSSSVASASGNATAAASASGKAGVKIV
ncbi:MAG: ESPR-type extended signal peptide-containing protein, partial [Burkholderiaceae bacterium]